jgi:hypothetical protein
MFGVMGLGDYILWQFFQLDDLVVYLLNRTRAAKRLHRPPERNDELAVCR